MEHGDDKFLRFIAFPLCNTPKVVKMELAAGFQNKIPVLTSGLEFALPERELLGERAIILGKNSPWHQGKHKCTNSNGSIVHGISPFARKGAYRGLPKLKYVPRKRVATVPFLSTFAGLQLKPGESETLQS
jgi:hypothetical protein